MNARRGAVAGVPVRTPAVAREYNRLIGYPAAWDRTGCQEQVCTCHDDTAPAYSCSACGCRAKETRDDPRAKDLELALLGLRTALAYAKRGKAPRLADAIRHAIKSAGGAIRHANNDAARARRKGGKS